VQSRAFFSLSLDNKLKAPHPPSASHQRGYSSLGREKVSLYAESTGNVFECKESFDIGCESDQITPNIWLPDEVLPGFRNFNLALFDSLHESAMQILRLLALGMGLDERFFDAVHSGSAPCNQMRLLHYPAVQRSALCGEETTRIAAHTDKGIITLLLQEDSGMGGLEVWKDGEFVPAPVVHGAILVNIGDLLQMWSNDVLKSTRHRVAAPPQDPEDKSDWLGSRLSIPYFVAPNKDAVLVCIGTCCGSERPKKYGPVKAWEYINRSMEPSYQSAE
jgi:isopenicillin N synthase-like dioxygenase